MSAFAGQTVSDGVVWAKTIPFTNGPTSHYLDIDFVMPRIFNYSEYFESLSPGKKAKLVSPDKIQTGDRVMANAYVRGVGTRYAVWLFAGVFSNSEAHRKKEREADGGEDAEEEGEVAGDVPPQPDDQSGSNRKRERVEIDPYSFGLDENVLMQLQDMLNDDNVVDPDAWTDSLRNLLKDRNPTLLEALLSDEDGTYTEVFSNLRFDSQAPPKARRGGDDDDDYEGEESDDDVEDDEDEDGESLLDEYGNTPNASYRFEKLPRKTYPKLVHRKELSKLSTLPFMQLYLFEHLDEYGYAAHTAVSMAPLNYFPGEYEDRHIDLALLPDVLRTGTDFGLGLQRVLDKLPQGRVSADSVALIRFQAEDAIMWMSAKDAEEYFGLEPSGMPSIEPTRLMFRDHAQKVRELVAGSADVAVTEHDLDEFLRGLLPSVFP